MEFDLTDPECFATQDPHPVFKRLRAEDPIHWTTGRISSAASGRLPATKTS